MMRAGIKREMTEGRAGLWVAQDWVGLRAGQARGQGRSEDCRAEGWAAHGRVEGRAEGRSGLRLGRAKAGQG
jgi:hypothetical protein